MKRVDSCGAILGSLVALTALAAGCALDESDLVEGEMESLEVPLTSTRADGSFGELAVPRAAARAGSTSDFKGTYVGMCGPGSTEGMGGLFRIEADGAGSFRLSADFTVPSLGGSFNSNESGTYQVTEDSLIGGDPSGRRFNFRGYLGARDGSVPMKISRYMSEASMYVYCFATLTPS